MDKKDYIERGAVIDVILKQPPEPHYPEWYYSDVKNIPAADVAPVVHGYWFFTEYEYFTCSVCGESYYNGSYTLSETRELLAEGKYYPYCPDCGAKMDGERKEK